MISPDIAVFAAFIAAVAFLLWRDRKKIQVNGVVFMRRTSRGKAWLDKTVKRHKRAWSIVAVLGVIAAVPAMAFITYFLVENALRLIMGTGGGAVSIVLPGPEFAARPGLLLVPWYFWILAVGILIIPHELAHGVAARLLKIKVKSLGLFLLAVLPGAFVEPDEKQLKRAPRMAKLKVYAIGSFVNFVTAAAFSLAAMALLSLAFAPAGIIPSGLAEGGPAAASNLSGAILSIGGVPTTSLETLESALIAAPVGGGIEVKTTTAVYAITTAKHPELDRSFLGILGPYAIYYVARPGLEAAEAPLMFLYNLLNFVFLFTLGVGLFNLLPVKPLDGGKFFEELLTVFAKPKAAASMARITSVILGLILIFSVVGPLVLTG
jgi:membrane-associated protease RseP (regulator of RpoE activity)